MGQRIFTLVELMIAISIVTVLAAIAIPRLHEATLSAKRAEVQTLTPTAFDHARLYVAGGSGPIVTSDVDATPQYLFPRADSALDGQPVPWVTGTAFDDIGFTPDGRVRGGYLCDVNQTGGYGSGLSGLCFGGIDADDDDVVHLLGVGLLNGTDPCTGVLQSPFETSSYETCIQFPSSECGACW